MKTTITPIVFFLLCAFCFSVSGQNPLGNGADGALSVTNGQTIYTDSIRTKVTGNNLIGTKMINVENGLEFTAGDEIIIITMQDPDTVMSNSLTGYREYNRVASASATILNLEKSLHNTYDATNGIKHQVIKVPNYTSVVIDGTLTCSPWDGGTGGVLAFRANNTVTVNSTGVISANGKGYRGGTQYGGNDGGSQGGEGYIGLGGYGGNGNGEEGAGGGGASISSYYGGNGLAGGGGGGTYFKVGKGSSNRGGAGGGGAGEAGSGGGAGYGTFGYGGDNVQRNGKAEDGGINSSGNGGLHSGGGGGGGGGTYGTADLTRIYPGSGGGCGGRYNTYTPGLGGNGGGIVIITAKIINNSGEIISRGNTGGDDGSASGAGGGGAGGSIYLQSNQLSNTNVIDTKGGAGGYDPTWSQYGGDGGNGRIRIDQVTINDTGTIDPSPYYSTFKNISTVELSNQTSTSGVYTVDAYVYDSHGDPISSATLYYRVNGGGFSSVAMNTSDGELFTGDIPAQSVNDVVDYYVSATDGSETYYDPESAPAECFSFKITGFPPANLSVVNNGDRSVTLNWEKPADLTNFVDYNIYRSRTKGFTPATGNRIAQAVTDTFYTDNNLNDLYTYYYIVGAHYNISGMDVVRYSSETNVTVNDSSTVTILGYVYLEGETNHSNIKIKFHDISPSAEPDSVYTDALGYFEITINPGVYDITYEKTNYQTYPAETNLSIVEDRNMGDITLKDLGTQVSGNISGVWDGLYSLTGDIIVPNGDSLIIMPGSEIRVSSGMGIDILVYGYLEAVGNVSDSILFTSLPPNQIYARGQWNGIDFYDNSDDNSTIEYAEIRYAVDGVYWENANASLSNSLVHNCSEDGIQINYDLSNPEITNVELRHNSDHGAHIYEGQPMFRDIYSHHNDDYGFFYNGESNDYAGGNIINCISSNNACGVYCNDYSSLAIDSSEISNNNSRGIYTRGYYCHLDVYNTKITANLGYGIRVNDIYSGHWTIINIHNCSIMDNYSHGVSLRYNVRQDSKISGNTISNNGSYGIYMEYEIDGGFFENEVYDNNDHGICIHNNHYSDPKIHHNTIAYNNGDGIYKNNYGSPVIEYNTIYFNAGDGIEINNDNYTHIINNNIIMSNTGWGVNANTYIDEFQYNDVYDNQAGQLSNTGNFPPNTWQFLSQNPNGAPADNYLNISRDPAFMFSDAYDFYLQDTSVCINAGDINVLDPDGTVSDIGALYRDEGNPHQLLLNGFADQSVQLSWEPIDAPTLLNYNVYYKIADSTNYTFYTSTSDTFITVNGLTNNQLYDFTITGNHTGFESIYSNKVSEKPGEPHVSFNPSAFNITVDADTVTRSMLITNTGTRDLELYFYEGTDDGYLYFDGYNDYVYVNDGDQTSLESMSALTIETWIRPYTTGWREIIGKEYNQYEMFLDVNNDMFGLRKSFDGTNNNNYYGYYDFNTSEWYHLAATWEGNTVKLYVNGELVNQYDNALPNAIPDHGNRFDIAEGNGHMECDMTEVRIWNVARTADEIYRYKGQTLTGNESGLAAYWPLHTDNLDYSPYNIPTNIYQCTFKGSGTPTLPGLPFVLSQQAITIAPGATDSVIFKFYDTGLEGTYVYKTPINTNIHDSSEIEYDISITYGTEVPSTPVYFSPVTSTGKPYQIVITDAEIDSTNIQVGDEIAVFDDTLCVGAGIFDGTFNFVLTAWEEDATAGFTPGNTMSFRVYDNSADLEATVTEVNYITGDGTFGYQTYTSLSLQSTIYKIQELPVTGNQFNLVSFFRLPRYAASSVVFGDIDSLKIAYNDKGYAIIPDYAINSIGDINFRDGYYLFTSADDTIHYEGTMINPMNWDIKVEPARWNYISYLGESAAPITTVFADSIKDSIDVVQDAEGYMWQPGGVNTIDANGGMKPGKGYMIALSVSSDLIFNYQTTNGFKSTLKETPAPEPEHFNFTETGLPYNIIIEDPVTNNGSSLQPGDEIAAFDNDVCVGAVVYAGSEKTVLTAWEGEDTYGLPGFEPANSIVIKVYLQAADEIYKTELTPVNGQFDLKYAGANYSRVKLKSLDDLTGTDPPQVQTGLISCYPNPFTEQVMFEYHLEKATDVQLVITNSIGQVVAILDEQFRQAGNYNIAWNGKALGEGVYYYSFITGNTIKTGKIVKIK